VSSWDDAHARRTARREKRAREANRLLLIVVVLDVVMIVGIGLLFGPLASIAYVLACIVVAGVWVAIETRPR